MSILQNPSEYTSYWQIDAQGNWNVSQKKLQETVAVTQECANSLQECQARVDATNVQYPIIPDGTVTAEQNFLEKYFQSEIGQKNLQEYPPEQQETVIKIMHQSIQDTSILVNNAVKTIENQPIESHEKITVDAFIASIQTVMNNFASQNIQAPKEIQKIWEQITTSRPQTIEALSEILHFSSLQVPKNLQELGYGVPKKTLSATEKTPNLVSTREFSLPDPQTIKTETLINADHYTNAIAGNILYYPQEYQFLKEKDPAFYEVLQLFWGQRSTLSTDAYRAMIGKIQDPNNEALQKAVEKEAAGINKKPATTEPEVKSKEALQTQLLWGKSGKGLNTYQLAMKKVAELAKSKMQGIENLPPYVTTQQLDEQVGTKGHFVPVENTKTSSNLLNAENAGRLSVGNLIIDQVVRFWGMMVVGANAAAAMKDGQWAARAPLLAIGGAVTYGAAEGVLNGGIDKWMHPENMPENIMKESFSNKYYIEYFGNPWEIALAKQMKVPNNASEKAQFMKEIDTMKKRKLGENDGKDLTYEQGGEKVSRKDKNLLKNSLCGSDFNQELKEYLPNEQYQSPDGTWLSKADFLSRLDKHGASSTARLSVLEGMVKRLEIGSSGKTVNRTSPFQYLDQLHILAKNNQDKKVQ